MLPSGMLGTTHPCVAAGEKSTPNQEELIDKRQAYHRDKGNDEPFDALIGVGKEEDEHGCRREQCAPIR